MVEFGFSTSTSAGLFGGGLVIKSCLTLCDPMDFSPPGSSLSMGFSRQEYWSGLLFASPGDLPHPGIEPGSPALQMESLLSYQGSLDGKKCVLTH